MELLGWAKSLWNWWHQDARQYTPFEETPVDDTPAVRFYGGDGTIHHTGHIDVVTNGSEVTEVWFRCQVLPFEQHLVGEDHASVRAPIQPEINIVGLFLEDVE